jgi:hypothetical protein
MNSIYDSQHSQKVDQETQSRAAAAFAKSKEPYKTGVISRNYKANDEASSAKVSSRLAGVDIPKEDFTHNNMMPFFGGSIKQSLNEHAASAMLSHHTGVDQLQVSKREVETFSDNKKMDSGNVYGMTGTYQFEQDRMYRGRIKNHEQPQPIRVGPGLNKGFTAEPTGGFQQLDTLDYAQQKSVDDLRVATKPKLTFEGRTVDGQFVKLPGESAPISKNRPDTFFDNTPDRWFTTTGAMVKDTERPEELLKCTAREVTSTESYQGGAYRDIKAPESRPGIKNPTKQNLEEFGIRNADLHHSGLAENSDHNRKSYKTYSNARDITACRTYEGNLISAVKAWVAPFTDAARSTTKQFTTASARTYGSMSVQIPQKLTIYDPNDVAKTTIKETLIHDERTGEFKGVVKATVHDPNDIAKTTIKETLIHDEYIPMIKGATRITVYDPDDIARVTTKETLPRTETNINMRAVAGKGQAYDPDAVARTTTKETTLQEDRAGNFGTTQAGNAYINTEWDVKLTQRQFLSDKEYTGDAYDSQRKTGAYKVQTYDMKATQKQFTTDNDYYGTGRSTNEAHSSKAAYDAAIINSTKELLEEGRAPTQNGAKVAAGGDTVNMNIVKKDSAAVPAARMTGNKDHVMNVAPTKEMMQWTHSKKSYVSQDADRLDPDLLKAFKENPYTHSLHSTY